MAKISIHTLALLLASHNCWAGMLDDESTGQQYCQNVAYVGPKAQKACLDVIKQSKIVKDRYLKVTVHGQRLTQLLNEHQAGTNAYGQRAQFESMQQQLRTADINLSNNLSVLDNELRNLQNRHKRLNEVIKEVAHMSQIGPNPEVQIRYRAALKDLLAVRKHSQSQQDEAQREAERDYKELTAVRSLNLEVNNAQYRMENANRTKLSLENDDDIRHLAAKARQSIKEGASIEQLPQEELDAYLLGDELIATNSDQGQPNTTTTTPQVNDLAPVDFDLGSTTNIATDEEPPAWKQMLDSQTMDFVAEKDNDNKSYGLYPDQIFREINKNNFQSAYDGLGDADSLCRNMPFLSGGCGFQKSLFETPGNPFSVGSDIISNTSNYTSPVASVVDPATGAVSSRSAKDLYPGFNVDGNNFVGQNNPTNPAPPSPPRQVARTKTPPPITSGFGEVVAPTNPIGTPVVTEVTDNKIPPVTTTTNEVSEAVVKQQFDPKEAVTKPPEQSVFQSGIIGSEAEQPIMPDGLVGPQQVMAPTAKTQQVLTEQTQQVAKRDPKKNDTTDQNPDVKYNNVGTPDEFVGLSDPVNMTDNNADESGLGFTEELAAELNKEREERRSSQQYGIHTIDGERLTYSSTDAPFENTVAGTAGFDQSYTDAGNTSTRPGRQDQEKEKSITYSAGRHGNTNLESGLLYAAAAGGPTKALMPTAKEEKQEKREIASIVNQEVAAVEGSTETNLHEACNELDEEAMCGELFTNELPDEIAENFRMVVNFDKELPSEEATNYLAAVDSTTEQNSLVDDELKVDDPEPTNDDESILDFLNSTS